MQQIMRDSRELYRQATLGGIMECVTVSRPVSNWKAWPIITGRRAPPSKFVESDHPPIGRAQEDVAELLSASWAGRLTS